MSKARENAGDQVLIGFGFASDWLKGGASFKDQSPHEVKQKQSNPELVSTLNGKLRNYENNGSKSAKFIYLSTQSIFGCFSNLKVKGSSVKSLQLKETPGLFMVKRKIVKYR